MENSLEEQFSQYEIARKKRLDNLEATTKSELEKMVEQQLRREILYHSKCESRLRKKLKNRNMIQHILIMDGLTSPKQIDIEAFVEYTLHQCQEQISDKREELREDLAGQALHSTRRQNTYDNLGNLSDIVSVPLMDCSLTQGTIIQVQAYILHEIESLALTPDVAPRGNWNETPKNEVAYVELKKDLNRLRGKKYLSKRVCSRFQDILQPNFLEEQADELRTRLKRGLNEIANTGLSDTSPERLYEIFTQKIAEISTRIPLSFDVESPFSEVNKENFSQVMKSLNNMGLFDEDYQEKLIETLFPAPEKKVRPSKTEKQHEPSYDETEDKYLFLQVMFDLSKETADNYVKAQTYERFDVMYQNLVSAVGEEIAPRLVKTNPALLNLSKGEFDKHCSTIRVVQKKIEGDYRTRELLTKVYGIENRFNEYASVEGLQNLKASLFTEGKVEVVDMEMYKDSLLKKAGINPDTARAIFEGRNAEFYEAPGTAGQLRRNVRRVTRTGIHHFEPTLLRLLLCDAIIDEGGEYVHNGDVDKISDEFVQEYVRVSRAEGQVQPLYSLEELRS